MSAKLGNKRILEILHEKHGNLYDYSRVTTDKRHDFVEIGCKEHGWVKTDLGNLLRGQRGCVQCKGLNIAKALKMPQQTFIDKLKAAFPTGFDFSNTVYKNMTTDIEINCLRHGLFTVMPLNLLREDRNNPCWKCACGSRSSKAEQSLSAWCEMLGVTIVQRTRKIIAPKEIDIWFPEHNFGIEFHGLFWHHKDEKGLVDKYKLAEKAGIRLVQIFEDDWKHRPEIVKDLIRAKLGLRETVYARKTNIISVDASTANIFYSKWHIAGPTKGCLYLGLQHNNELTAVLTICKSRYTTHDFEIARYAASCNVVGGFDKLFKSVRLLHPLSSFISYADLRFGQGKQYLSAGFTSAGDTVPDYWWFRQKTRLTRYATQKHILKADPKFSKFFKPELSEREICLAAGYNKIYGVGHRRWIFQPK
jgi:hypothetical protein